MSFIRFGKKIENRQFDYIPRFYDPDKEELEQRLKRYNASPGDTDLAKVRIKGGFRRAYRTDNSYTSNSQKRSNRILMVTLIGLVALSYVFIMNYLPRIIVTLGL